MSTIRSLFHLSMAAWLVLGLASAPAGAEEPKPEPAPSPSPEPHRGTRPGDVQKVFVLKHVRADDMAELLSIFPAEIRHVGRGANQTLSVSAAPAVVAAIEETVKRLDVLPPRAKSVDVTAYVLECWAQGSEGAGIPPELQGVLAQLKRTFGYGGCSLAHSLSARAQGDSDFRASGTLIADKRPDGSTFMGQDSFGANQVDIDSLQTPATIRFRRLMYGSPQGNFNGDVEMLSGQRIVLGNLGSVEGGRTRVLVLGATVVD